MFGLIKKDLLMIKGNFKTISIIFIVFILVSINGNNNFSYIPAFISVMAMTTTFSYDEYNKTDAFITTLPNGKRNAIKSKYIATLLIILISIILTFIISIVVGYAENNLNMENVIATTIGCCGGVVLLQSVFYPFIVKYGVEKSRIGMFIVVFGIVGIGAIFIKKGWQINISQNIITFFSHYWMIITPLVIMIILLISYKISEYFYLKKEF